MKFLVCTVDIDPCPAVNVSSLTVADVIDFAALGITPTEIAYVYGWGFAAVLGAFFVGYGVRLAIGLINKL